MTARRPILTARHLTDAKACPERVRLFRQTFPEGAPLTVASLRLARRAGLDVGWCVFLLDPEALEAYQRATAPAWEKYDRVTALAWEEYGRVTAPAWEEYERVTAPAWEEYERVADRALLAGLIATFTRRGAA